MRVKVLSGLRLAARLVELKDQEVRIFLYGPGVRPAESDDRELQKALADCAAALIPVGACPVNAERIGVDMAPIADRGAQLDQRAVDAMVQLIEDGYQVIGV